MNESSRAESLAILSDQIRRKTASAAANALRAVERTAASGPTRDASPAELMALAELCQSASTELSAAHAALFPADGAAGAATDAQAHLDRALALLDEIVDLSEPKQRRLASVRFA